MFTKSTPRKLIMKIPLKMLLGLYGAAVGYLVTPKHTQFDF